MQIVCPKMHRLATSQLSIRHPLRPEPSQIPLQWRIPCSRSGRNTTGGIRPVLLFDIMDTVVTDPFYKQIPKFFDLSFRELLEVKHPEMWILFEKGEVEEQSLLENFFSDRRLFDHNAFVAMMCENYNFIEGMQELLKTLKALDVEMHAFSNYPIWYRKIEDKLKLSSYLDWTFVSCSGPMKGLRKPEAKAFEIALDTLECSASDVLLIDDREPNIKAAQNAGMDTILFKSSDRLIEQLTTRGWDL